MMTPRQKTEIRAEFLALWQKDFGDVEKKIEYAHQALNVKGEVAGLANNELRNAIGDSRQALNVKSYKRAKLRLAHGRRHLYRARRLYLATAVHALEKQIGKWLKDLPTKGDPEAQELRKRAKGIREDRLLMPKLRGAIEGGNLESVQRKTARLHNECVRWGALFRRALQLYDELTD